MTARCRSSLRRRAPVSLPPKNISSRVHHVRPSRAPPPALPVGSTVAPAPWIHTLGISNLAVRRCPHEVDRLSPSPSSSRAGVIDWHKENIVTGGVERSHVQPADAALGQVL